MSRSFLPFVVAELDAGVDSGSRPAAIHGRWGDPGSVRRGVGLVPAVTDCSLCVLILASWLASMPYAQYQQSVAGSPIGGQCDASGVIQRLLRRLRGSGGGYAVGTAQAHLLTEIGVGRLTAVVAATLSFVPASTRGKEHSPTMDGSGVAMAISAAICRHYSRIVLRVIRRLGLQTRSCTSVGRLSDNSLVISLVQVLFNSVVLGSSFTAFRVAAPYPGRPNESLPSFFSSASDSWVGSRCGTASGRRFGLVGFVCRQCSLRASPRQCYPSHPVWPGVAQRVLSVW